MAFNTAAYTNAITIDCDHARCPELVEPLSLYGCPEPNCIVTDPFKGTSHATWILDAPVRTTADARPKAIKLLGAVRDGLTAMLDGDLAYTNRLTKNPWAAGRTPASRWDDPALPMVWDAYCAARTGLLWHTAMLNPEPAQLCHLAEAVNAWTRDQDYPRQPWRPRVRQFPAAETARGRRLFDAARFRVYAAGATDDDEIRSIIDAEAERLGSPATDRARATMAKGMGRFMRTKWGRRRGRSAGCGRNRGTMHLERKDLPLPEKQSLAAKRSRAIVAARNDLAIGAAFEALRAEGIHVTQAAVAVRAGVSLRTVASRWAVLKRAPGTCNKLSYPLVALGATSSTPINGCVAKDLTAGKAGDVERYEDR